MTSTNFSKIRLENRDNFWITFKKTNDYEYFCSKYFLMKKTSWKRLKIWTIHYHLFKMMQHQDKFQVWIEIKVRNDKIIWYMITTSIKCQDYQNNVEWFFLEKQKSLLEELFSNEKDEQMQKVSIFIDSLHTCYHLQLSCTITQSYLKVFSRLSYKVTAFSRFSKTQKSIPFCNISFSLRHFLCNSTISVNVKFNFTNFCFE